MLGSIGCTPHATYNYKVGDHVSSVTASASVTCSAEVYDQQAALAMGGSLLKNSIAATPNTTYILGPINASIAQVSAAGGGTVELLVKAQTTGVIQFSAAQKAELIGLIVGKTTQEAQVILLNQPGISKAAITVSGGDGKTLPTDAKQIALLVSEP